MSDIANIVYMAEARKEIAALPAADQARVVARIEQVQKTGWQNALETQTVKKLRGDIYEIRVAGKGSAYRVLCFQTGGQGGRIVVTTSCETKSNLLRQRRLRQAISRAESRREKWFTQGGA